MNTNMRKDPQFKKYYRKHHKCLKLAGLQPKTVDAYSRAIRRIGNYFDCRIDNLTIPFSGKFFAKTLYLTVLSISGV